MTEAEAFMRANDRSPVVDGRLVTVRGGKSGVCYRLENGRQFTLSSDECRSLAEGYPRWLFPEETHNGNRYGKHP